MKLGKKYVIIRKSDKPSDGLEKISVSRYIEDLKKQHYEIYDYRVVQNKTEEDE